MANERASLPLRPVLPAAAGAFALAVGTRPTMGLFLSAFSTSTELGVVSAGPLLILNESTP